MGGWYDADGFVPGHLLGQIISARPLFAGVITGTQTSGWIKDHTFERIGVKTPPNDEPYVLPEDLSQAHAVTGERRYLDMAKLYLLDKGFFDPLAAGENVLPGRHGYSHVIALSSAAKAYEVLGEAKYLRAIR